MYHADEGLCFTRQPDGSVLVEKFSNDREQRLEMSILLPPSMWASIVSSMTKAGESYETWIAALKAQEP